MTRRLIVPLDGSELAERALPYAVKLLEADGGNLVLLRVALSAGPMTVDGAGWDKEQLAAVREATEYLTGVRFRLGKDLAISTEVPYGRAAREIVSAVSLLGADAVVMATHGRTGLAHLLYGSVAEEVLAASGVPVLLVHAQPGQFATQAFDPATARIMVPLDGTAISEAGLVAAGNFVHESGHLILVTVVPGPDDVRRDENGRVLAYIDEQVEGTAAARDYLDMAVRGLLKARPELGITTEILAGDAVEGIVSAATSNRADLIVMATHGHTGLKRALVGSVAGAVLERTRLPVVLVRPDADWLTKQPGHTGEPMNVAGL